METLRPQWRLADAASRVAVAAATIGAAAVHAADPGPVGKQ